MTNLTISFTATNTDLENTTGRMLIPSDTIGYIIADFTLSTNWTGWDAIKAVWQAGNVVIAVPLDDGECVVPHEVLAVRDTVKVNLVGYTADENDELTERLTTFQTVALNIGQKVNVEGDESTPTILAQIDQLVAEATQAAEDANAAKEAIEDMDVSASTLSAGSSATVTKTIDPDTGEISLAFGIPKGDKGDTGNTGATGADGVSPAVTISEITGGHSVSITDKDHPSGQSFNIMDGEDGQDGQDGQDGADGYSPTATVTKSGSTATITITDKNGTTTAQVNDGVGAITDVTQNGTSVLDGTIAKVVADANTIETVKVDGSALTPDTNKAVNIDLSGKVDKVTGKGLSANDFTDTLKTKLDNIASGAEVNVQSDWNQSDNTADDYIKNKPTIPTVPTNVSAFTNDAGYLTSHQDISGKADKSDLASISETGSTASQAISNGTYFYLNGTLVKAITDIASGATFTSGTNYSAVTAGGLNELNSNSAYYDSTDCSIVFRAGKASYDSSDGSVIIF